MILEHIRRSLVMALLLPLLGGCFVTSKYPAVRPGEDGRDPALRGLWVTPEGREFLHILRPELKDGKAKTDERPGFSGLYVISRGEGPDDRDGWSRVRMIATKVKDRKLLSMRFTEGESAGDLKDIPGWLIFSYKIVGGRLYLQMMDEDVIDAAIKSGALDGTPKSGAYSDPQVTASAEKLIAFLERADLDTLFKKDNDSYVVRVSRNEIRELAEKSAGEPLQAKPDSGEDKH